MLTKKDYDNRNVKDEGKKGCDYKHFKIIDNKNQITKLTKKRE